MSAADACQYLSEVGLCAKDYINREVNASLSGGELKRIEIATVLARGTQLSVFDEPEAGIDLWSFQNLIQVFERMQEKTKEMGMALTNNMEEYRTQKKAREKRLMAYAEEIQKNTLQMSSALIAELVAERKYQKKTQQDIADITGILPANIARFENGSRVPTLVVLQKYASALGKRIKVELCDQEAK